MVERRDLCLGPERRQRGQVLDRGGPIVTRMDDQQWFGARGRNEVPRCIQRVGRAQTVNMCGKEIKASPDRPYCWPPYLTSAGRSTGVEAKTIRDTVIP